MVVAGLVISIIALVFGLIGFGVPILSLIGLPVAIVGLVLGCIGRKRTPGGMGTAALVIGIIAIVFTAITFFTCGLCVLCVAGAAGAVV